ncbi:Lsr2 family DNA-binding protein [Glycomyces sambucus]|uniref:Lsr2 family DNA-binding protein n=1 Tax=Glycomyces sambucus TaxID=380244 RepID=UPI000B81BC05
MADSPAAVPDIDRAGLAPHPGPALLPLPDNDHRGHSADGGRPGRSPCWAESAGKNVAPRGRIPQAIVDEYNAAHS